MSVDARGIVAWEVGAPVRPEPIVVDEPGPGEILVRVEASGVCHTDLHIRNGAIGTLPILLGHGYGPFALPKMDRYGFWSFLHESRTDFCMWLGALFLLIVGAGRLSLDATLGHRAV